MAKMPGEIPGMSWPVSLPKNAPASLERCQIQSLVRQGGNGRWLEELLKTHNEGMMIPLGTLMPNVTMVRMSLVSVP